MPITSRKTRKTTKRSPRRSRIGVFAARVLDILDPPLRLSERFSKNGKDVWVSDNAYYALEGVLWDLENGKIDTADFTTIRTVQDQIIKVIKLCRGDHPWAIDAYPGSEAAEAARSGAASDRPIGRTRRGRPARGAYRSGTRAG